MTAASCCVLNLLLLQVAEDASNRRVKQHVSNMFRLTLVFLAIMWHAAILCTHHLH